MSISEQVLAQYTKNTSKTTNNSSVSNEDRLKKYFNTILDKGQTTGEKRIRILPTKDGSSPFKEVYFHEVSVDGKYLKIYDPSQNNTLKERSPLNETWEGLRMSGVEADKELAKQYRPRKFYILKVIDRDNEADGVKFWRFKDNYKGEGIFDKIAPIFRSRGDITDINEGRDIILTLSLSTSNNGGKYTSVNSIIPDDKSPLSETKSMSEEWLEDELEWNNVYAVKPVEYLELIAQGKSPKWDNDLKKWSTEDEMNATSTFSGNASTEQPAEETKPTSTTIVDAQEDDEEDEDLPF